jgi:hypothetical protein
MPAEIVCIVGREMDAKEPVASQELLGLLVRLRRNVESPAPPRLLSESIQALVELEAQPSSARAINALTRDACAQLQLSQDTERWLLGATTALLDDASETEAAAVAAGWTRTEAREHLEGIRGQHGGLVAAEPRFARLGEQPPPLKAPPVTGIVLHDLSSRLAALEGSSATSRLVGHVNCARALRAQALAAEDQLHAADSSPGATVVRLRGESLPPHDSHLVAADIAGLREDVLRLLDGICARVDPAQPRDEAGSAVDDVDGPAPRDLAASRKASPRAA